MEREYRILGIAPCENLKNTMVTKATKYEDIEVVVYAGNLEDGTQLALQRMDEDSDILISRGGTAELIRKIASIPVVEITLSISDILRTILLVGNLTEAYAMVGYPTVTQPAHVLCEMMNYRMNIITIHNSDELDPVLRELKAGGCNFILCDMITKMMAWEAGVGPILILPRPESVDIAINYSVNMRRVLTETKARGRLFTRALDIQDMKTVTMKQDGSILFSTYNEKDISSVTGYLKKLTESPHSMSAKAFHMIENRLYSISVEETTFLEGPCYIFCLEQNPFPVSGSKRDVRFSIRTEVSVMYSNSFYSLTSGARPMEEKIHIINQTTLPAMILDERGSGKNQLAARLYLEGSMQRCPYITIDCQVLSERTWNYIISNYGSPLDGKNSAIFTSSLRALSGHQQEQLLSSPVGTNAHKRNEIILSCSQTLGRDLPDSFRNFTDYLPCTTVYMPPLWKLIDDTQGSSNLYLDAMNMEMPKQIVGFAPEALVLLMSYRQPDNFVQLKRVLAELVMLTSAAYIQRDTVFEVIEKEKRQYVPATADLFDYNRPLDEMTRKIVKVILSQCGGNQTLAAKRLGIGRTTLWRYLNETD